MQQNETAVQTIGELPAVRVKANLRDVEKLMVEKYLGIPYRHRGRAMDGFDCWGFLKLAYADLGVRLFDIEDLEYSKIWGLKGKDYFKDNYSHDWEKVNEPQVLDGILFVNSRGVANHAGIVLGNRRFIHCCRQGVMVSRLDDGSWIKKVEGFYRLRAWS
ncbi:MAG: C40 family peptidase [Candidatus Omnitrophica bacterium]|nr:C40 family peptidase [Candidatus Omnitrophota bacterium]